MKTQIKICGFTRPEDAVHAVSYGADTLGLVFYPPSKRHVSIDQASAIADAVGPLTSLTALFLNAEKSVVDEVLSALPISLLQFHGSESVEFCSSFNRPYIKSVPMGSVTDVEKYCQQYQDARGFLLDSNASGAAGGSGDSFNWTLIPQALSRLILAGGLSPNNVRDAVLAVQPSAVDVSTGVESSGGIKDADLMRKFILEVRQADASLYS